MRTSGEGIAFISQWEGVRLSPYDDSSGYATTGIGHLIAYRSVHTLTSAEIRKWTLPNRPAAFRLFADDLAHNGYEAAVNRAVRLYRLKLTQAMYDILVSVVFNLGVGALFDATHFGALVSALRKRDYHAIADALLNYDHARDPSTGRLVVVQGLLNRRRAERKHFGSEGWTADPVRDRMNELRAWAHIHGWTPLARNQYHQAEARIRLRRLRADLHQAVAKGLPTVHALRVQIDAQKTILRDLRAKEKELRK